MYENTPPGNYITNFGVSKLFGEIDYEISLSGISVNPRLLILYGDNGTGKTTILNIIESLISADAEKGLRSKLARIEFERVYVKFSSGLRVEAHRGNKDRIGAYNWIIRSPHSEVMAFRVKTRVGTTSVYASEWPVEQRERYENFIKVLASLVGEVELLDERRTVATEMVRHEDEPVFWRESAMLFNSDSSSRDPVFLAVRDLANSIRTEAFRRANRGTTDALSIYAQLANRISKGWKTTGEVSTLELNKLNDQLGSTQRRSVELAEYGLSALIDHGDLLASLADADESARNVLVEILSPYVESVTARFQLLEDLSRSLQNWVSTLNQFFVSKKVEFHLSEGVRVLSRGGNELSLDSLSSGERHLMIMMARALMKRNSTGIFIIDEPELSLNVKWQRLIVPALLQSFGNGGTQLVVASHSLDVAGVELSNVCKLE